MKYKVLTMRLLLVLALVLLALPATVSAQDRTGETKGSSVSLQSVNVDDTPTATQLAELLVGADVTLSNISFTGDPRGSGSFSGGTGIVGFESGVILGSGRVIDVVGPNIIDSTTGDFGLPGDSDLNSLIPGYQTYDATVLEFDFECPAGTGGEDVISFRYVFTSEEYNEWVNSAYNDVFGFFLNGTNIALLPDGVTPVSINNVNNGFSAGGGLPGINPSNPMYYINNDLDDGGPFIDIEADGLTVVLGAQASINPEVANHMRLAIADAGDHVLDSWVFIEEGSFQCAPLPPAAEAGGPYSGNEGSPISLDGTGSSDPDGDPLTYSWSVDSSLCTFDDATSSTPNLTCTDNGDFIVTLVVDNGQATDSDTAAVTVYNVAPTVGPISVDSTLVPVNAGIAFTAAFTDPGTADTHTAQWDWGDGTTPGTVSETGGSGSVTDSHTYSAAGVYEIQLTVTDDDSSSGQSVFQYVVVYDPSAGFVTGGGWIDSPEEAYVPDPGLVGKANFGFVSKYKKGADTPTGNTEFQFHAASLNFHSDSYEWLVVTGSDYARFKGVGTINGEGAYKFMLWAGEGDPDTFRIKIWTEDDLGNETVVYDNGFDQAIGGGSIVIHTGKK